MESTTARAPRTRPHPFRRGVVTLACVGLVATSGAALASPAMALTPASAASAGRPEHGHGNPLEPATRAVVAAGAVGHVAYVDDGRRVAVAVAGLADRATGRALRPDDQFEIGSNTKTFVSVLALQLVARGQLKLTDSVEKVLPGVVPGGDRVTVKMLLQHTSGLFNYTADEPFFQSVLADPKRVWTPAELVAVAVRHRPDFAPGTSWNYSNTNYVLVGMIVEKVAGHPVADLIEHRIARPLGLTHTYLATTTATNTGRGYAHGYVGSFTGARPAYTDVSGWALGGWAGTAGAVISTPAELARFFSAVLAGRLLPPAQLAAMQQTVPLPKDFGGVVGGYGLGLMRIETPCGTVWGHGGDTLGHHSTAVTTPDGRGAAVTDTTTEPSSVDGPNPKALALVAASGRAELVGICRMLGKPVPAQARTPAAAA